MQIIPENPYPLPKYPKHSLENRLGWLTNRLLKTQRIIVSIFNKSSELEKRISELEAQVLELRQSQHFYQFALHRHEVLHHKGQEVE